ncbi:MAG: cupin domain-containing protein [Rhodobacteraceae bacterium]|nr:cupin domain-containing protein [Paracoccaceae bacterium]
MSKTHPVISLADLSGFPMRPDQPSGRFGAMIAPLGPSLGLSGLGAMQVTVEPGRRAFPFHSHVANDEMFVILEGKGTYRFGASDYPVKAGDVCAAPKGGPDTAHQLINTGTGPLRYLGISTRNDPDVAEYPDSGKYAVMAIWPGANFMEAHLRQIHRAEDGRDYWEGEQL